MSASLYTPWGFLPLPNRDHLLPVATLPAADTSSHPSPALPFVRSQAHTYEPNEAGAEFHGKVVRNYGKEGGAYV